MHHHPQRRRQDVVSRLLHQLLPAVAAVAGVAVVAAAVEVAVAAGYRRGTRHCAGGAAA